MPGFGRGKFGTGGFGNWPWADNAIVGSLPAVYIDADAQQGYKLTNLLDVVGRSLDEQRVKIRDFDGLRDPFLVQTDQTLQETVKILQVDNLGDGTSRVFLSNGPNSDKFNSIRLGQTIQDNTATRFNIVAINSSDLPSDYTTLLPIDPNTGVTTAKNIIVQNISQGTKEVVPQVSGIAVAEVPASTQYISAPNGSLPPPYVFTTIHAPLAQNQVSLSWTESGVAKSGTFTNTGGPTGDLAVGSVIDFTAGKITVFTKDLGAADSLSFSVSYSYLPGTEDATINSQNLLTFLGQDFGVQIDQHEPEVLQRGYVNHAIDLWNIKGSADGYSNLGALAGFFVEASRLYRLDDEWVSAVPSSNLFQLVNDQGQTNSYTDLDPRRAVVDEVPADEIPTDYFAFQSGFPSLVQDVTISSVTFVRTEGNDYRYQVTATPSAGQMNRSLAFPQATFTDSSSQVFSVENFSIADTTSYTFDTISPDTPAAGAGQITWQALAIPATIQTGGVIKIGTQYVGYTGQRVSVQIRFSISAPTDESMVAGVALGNWAMTFADGTSAWVESMMMYGSNLAVEVVTPSVPADSTSVYLVYVPPVTISCDWCAASTLRLVITPDAILSYSSTALEDDPVTRLTKRLEQMLPAHVRLAQFVFDSGPGIAAYPEMIAYSTTNEVVTDPVSFTPLFDDPESWPADAISTPGTYDGLDQMVATSTSASTSPYFFEEHVDGSEPLSNGWVATGLWSVTRTRPAYEYPATDAASHQNYVTGSGTATFGYGTTDPDSPFHQRIDLNGMPNTGSLTSPLIDTTAAGSGQIIGVKFMHYADVTTSATNYLVWLDVLDSLGNVLHSFSKTDLGGSNNCLLTYGYTVNPNLLNQYTTSPQWTQVALDITSYATAAGNKFFLRWRFDTVTSTTDDLEGWFIDDIYVFDNPAVQHVRE